MALKPVSLRLDEEEYEKLREYLSEFGDPDINVAFVLRSYIRDLNRALPFFIKSGWDLKNYFGLLGSWLKQFGSVSDKDIFARMAVNPWTWWNMKSSDSGPQGEADDTDKETDKGEEKNPRDEKRKHEKN
ncbi:MAG TPA: hypothetical protein VEM15_02745 [Thermodesulfobacteriota bacterium]|nr:hypothetical protein [Thermodesulfobacteriota bacterium]